MPACPTCQKKLRTRQGMRQHHTKVHGEPLSNRTCKGCGDQFYDKKARRTFCEDCNPNAGVHNGNWSGALKEAECRRCETTFTYYLSDKLGVYCSVCVANATEFLGTPYAEVHDIQRVEKTCEQCGTVQVILASEAKSGAGRFCSQSCLAEWLSESWRGENHPSWKGGSLEHGYRGDWWQVRRLARERGDHMCQRCGSGQDELGQEPDVHHIEPVRDFDDPNDAHRLDNVICLCRQCHRRVESGSVPLPGSDDRE